MFVIDEAVEALDLIDMTDPEKPLSEELSPEGIEWLKGLSQEVLDCMEALREGALASRERIINEKDREV